MDCKHMLVKGNYCYCELKQKVVDKYNCKDCMMRISSLPKTVEDLFGKGFRR